MLRRDSHELNRQSWNAATKAHNSHKRDQAAFLRNGGCTLFSEELELLGDVNGKRVVHLQCNCGQDSLSLARRGAAVTGVDISDAAISFAKELAFESGISATFERADLYDWFDRSSEAALFDIAFASYGTVYWLSDLDRWARGIASVLKPGGKFVLLEFHPVMMIFDEELRHAYTYGQAEEPVECEAGVDDYVALSGPSLAPSGYADSDEDFRNPHPCHEFTWGLGQIVSAIIRSGLRLIELREYTYSNGFRPFTGMVESERGRLCLPPDTPDLPLMFGIVAER